MAKVTLQIILERIEAIHKRFDGLDARLATLEFNLDGVGAKVDSVESEVEDIGVELGHLMHYLMENKQ